MSATHLSDHLCVPTTKVIHFDKLEFLINLSLQNWALLSGSLNTIPQLVWAPEFCSNGSTFQRSQMCPDKTYLCSGTYPDQQHKILFLPSQIITSNGQGFIFTALLKLLATTQMNRCPHVFSYCAQRSFSVLWWFLLFCCFAFAFA